MARHPQALKSCRRAPWTTGPEPVFEPSPSWRWAGVILTHMHTDICRVRNAARVWQDPALALQHVFVHVGGPQGRALVSLPTSCCLCLGLGPSNPIFTPQGACCWEPPLGDPLDKAEGPFAGVKGLSQLPGAGSCCISEPWSWCGSISCTQATSFSRMFCPCRSWGFCPLAPRLLCFLPARGPLQAPPRGSLP